MATPNLQRIQVIKHESGALGGSPADDFPFDVPLTAQEDALEAAGIYLQDINNRDEQILITRSGDNMMFYDITVGSGVSLYQLLQGETGGGITTGQHRALDQLVHNVAESSYEEYVYVGGKISSIITWTDVSKTTKIRQEDFSYTGNKVTTATTVQYDAAGSPVTGETMVETFNYSGNDIVSVDRVVT